MCSTDDLDLFDPQLDEIVDIRMNVNNENPNIYDDIPNGFALRNELRDNLFQRPL